jgi:hypothetical protein
VTDLKAFIKKHSLPIKKTLENCCTRIEALLMPICKAVAAQDEFQSTWKAETWS